MAQPAVIEPVRRSLTLLEALSRRPQGTIAELAAETALPRPTVARLLNTLVAVGYVSHLSRASGYRLTERVLGLAQGIRFVDRLVDVAAPHMRRFTEKHSWPLYLGTVSQRAIVIRFTTLAESPLSFERTPLPRNSPVLAGAMGRAWLAYCSDEERRAVLRELGERLDPKLAAVLARVRRDGCAFSALPGRIQGIAVAIRRRNRVLGCISMRFLRSALSDAEAGARYGAELNALARAIAAEAKRA